MLYSLLNGYSKAEIARRHSLTAYKLNRTLRAIGRQYLEEYG